MLTFFLKVYIVNVLSEVLSFSVLFSKCISRVRTINEVFVLVCYVLRQPFFVLGCLYSAAVGVDCV